MKVRWTKEASENLEAISDYIALDNTQAATQTVHALHEKAELLAQFPDIGRIGQLDNTRELIVPALPYIVVYRIQKSVIDILAVFHTSRNWPEA